MCSLFGSMENYQGDLTDIVRGSAYNNSYEAAATGSAATISESDHNINISSDWQFPLSDPMNFSSNLELDSPFGDPFSSMSDPLIHQLHDMSCDSTYFGSTNIITGPIGGNINVSNRVLEDEIKRPCNIFSRMLQISPSSTRLSSPSSCDNLANSLRAIKASNNIVQSNMNIDVNNSSNCLVDNSTSTGMQISSPRNTGIKRRKSQAKKVVCIPAPAAANSRQTGEVVPSDLWAWRKYGQKPIKGSPHPRGYYRCSSSKGCSARKQVERSRTDPNMLVITYTSEHNHPWPTQRNALAGSTRSQPSKNTNAVSKSSPTTYQSQKITSPKEEQNNNDRISNINVSPIVTGSSSTASASVKEEIDEIEKQIGINVMDDGEFSTDHQGFQYGSNQSEDFFAELSEIETDAPLKLLFTQGFSSGSHDQKDQTKGIDSFMSLFDWSEDNTNVTNNDINTSSFEEPREIYKKT